MLAARRLDRRVPVRVRGHARGAASKVRPTEFEDLVALVALYRPGAMDQIPTYARGKRNPDAVTLPRRAPAADHRVDQGRDPLPGAGDADRQGARRLQRAPRRTTCARRSARRTARRWPSCKPEFVEGCQAIGTAPVGDREAVGDEREVGRLLVQQVPRRLLRADRLPHRLAEGQLPGRVHGGADLLGDGHEGQGPVLRRADASRWGSRSCRRT